MILNRKKKIFLEGLYNFSVLFHTLRLGFKLPTEARSTYVWMKAIVTRRHLVQGIMRQLVPFIFPFLFPYYYCVVTTTCSFWHSVCYLPRLWEVLAATRWNKTRTYWEAHKSQKRFFYLLFFSSAFRCSSLVPSHLICIYIL